MNTQNSGSTSRWGTIAVLAVLGIGLAVIIGVGLTGGFGASGRGGEGAERAGGESGGPDGGVSLDEDELDILGTHVQQLMMDGNWQEAAGALDAAVKRRPDHPELRERYAQTLMRLGRFAEAREQWVALIDLGEATAENEFLAGMCASSAGNREAAEGHFERALAAKPTEGDYALNLGITQKNLGKLGEARASLVIAVTRDPTLAAAWGTLAQIALENGEREIALEQIRRARELAPEQPEWLVVEADALLRTGPGSARDPEAVLGLLASLDDQWLMRRDVLEIAKRALGMLGRLGEAGALYARAADNNVRDADLAAQAAELLARDGQNARAIEYARRAVRLGDEGAQPLVDRLEAELAQGG